MRLKYILLNFMLPLLAAWGQNVAPVIETSLDSTAILIGQQVMLHTKVTTAKGAAVTFPEYPQGYLTEGIEVLDRSRVDTTYTDGGQHWILSRDYLLTSFDSALYKLPPLEIRVGQHSYESRDILGLKVSSVEVDTVHMDDIRDPYGPISIPFTWSTAFLMKSMVLWGLVLLFVLSLCQQIKREPRRRRISIAPPPPAHQVALTAIEKFKGRVAESEEDMKRYYDELTDILRTYIKERFNIDAREMTSAQLIQALTSAEDETALYDLRQLLQTADLVKFARYQTTAIDNDRSLLYALEYVNQTKSEEPAPERIIKIVDIDKRQRRMRMTLKWTCTILTGCATTGYTIWLIYILVDTFR